MLVSLLCSAFTSKRHLANIFSTVRKVNSLKEKTRNRAGLRYEENRRRKNKTKSILNIDSSYVLERCWSGVDCEKSSLDTTPCIRPSKRAEDLCGGFKGCSFIFRLPG